MAERKAKRANKVAIEARPASTEMCSKWSGIRDTTSHILKAFKALEAKQVNWRLNVSNTTFKRPVFIDWLALEKLTLSIPSGLAATDNNNGNPDWGLYRLGDGLTSTVYNEAVGNPPNLICRDWSLGEGEKKAESLKLVQKAGLNYQKFIGIIASDENSNRRCVGALTVSFKNDPNNPAVDDQMKKWAGWDPWPGKEKTSPLVKFITENFILGGPELSASLKKK
jgi:hypothetical protein